MGKIADKAKALWDYNDCMRLFAEEIDAEFSVLRQDIQDLKCLGFALHGLEGLTPITVKGERFKERMMKIVIDTKAQLAKVEAEVFEGRIPEPKAPQPELQRGDVISYIADGSVPGRMKGDKVLGIFHHLESYRVWAHFQNANGVFQDQLNFMPGDRITLELRPEK